MRIRTVKPAFWSNEKLATLSEFSRLLALALLNYADDHGYFWANPLMIRGSLFPFDDDSSKIRRSLAQLCVIGFVKLGKTTDGREVGFVVNFKKHQRVDRPQDSDIKDIAKFDERSTNDLRLIDDDSSLDRKGMEGKGKDSIPPYAPVGAAEGLKKKSRERNPVIDALAACDGSDPLQITPKAWSGVATALKEIRSVSPDVTSGEINRRAANYRAHHPDAAISPHALAKHWAKCERGPNGHTSEFSNSWGAQT